MKRKKTILLFATFVTTIMTGLFSWVAINRLTMDYNENGVYFDEETLTTYSSQALIFYCGLAGSLLAVTIILILKLRKPQH